MGLGFVVGDFCLFVGLGFGGGVGFFSSQGFCV